MVYPINDVHTKLSLGEIVRIKNMITSFQLRYLEFFVHINVADPDRFDLDTDTTFHFHAITDPKPDPGRSYCMECKSSVIS